VRRLFPTCWQDWFIVTVVGSAVFMMMAGCAVKATHQYELDWFSPHHTDSPEATDGSKH
jgi:hypothetical protein